MAQPILSILIPSIPERSEKLKEVIEALQKQIDNRPHEFVGMGEIEIISLMDNKQRTIGQKRFDLFNLAQGKYVCMTDDDDEYTPIFIEKVLQAINHINADVITFSQMARIDNSFSIVNFRLGQDNEDFKGAGITRRMAWHCCVWKKEIIEGIKFGNSNYGEDDSFAREANLWAKTECHIPETLHIYDHQGTKSASYK
jgi:glycosyltransferase involved in cell wall biosynthesis